MKLIELGSYFMMLAIIVSTLTLWFPIFDGWQYVIALIGAIFLSFSQLDIDYSPVVRRE